MGIRETSFGLTGTVAPPKVAQIKSKIKSSLQPAEQWNSEEMSRRECILSPNHAPAPLLSPTGYEYYLLLPTPSPSEPTTITYEKHLLPLDPSVQFPATTTSKVDVLDESKFLALESLLSERNARTVGEGQWVLSGLQTSSSGSKDFRSMITFRRYGDEFVDLRLNARDAVKNEPDGASKESPIQDAFESKEEAMENPYSDYD
ncbi:hypothetical protein RUND412_008246 [Rhizina undulata]